MARSVELIVSGGTVRRGGDVEGAAYPGQQLVLQQFGDAAGQTSVCSQVERTAISVELTDPDRVAGSVEPGTCVAIFVSEDPEPYLADASARRLPPLTRILLPKVQVLGVGEPTDVDTETETAELAPRTILTIAVTQAEAEKVICGARSGDLTFAVRSDKVQVANRPGTTDSEIAPELYDSAS